MAPWAYLEMNTVTVVNHREHSIIFCVIVLTFIYILNYEIKHPVLPKAVPIMPRILVMLHVNCMEESTSPKLWFEHSVLYEIHWYIFYWRWNQFGSRKSDLNPMTEMSLDMQTPFKMILLKIDIMMTTWLIWIQSNLWFLTKKSYAYILFSFFHKEPSVFKWLLWYALHIIHFSLITNNWKHGKFQLWKLQLTI